MYYWINVFLEVEESTHEDSWKGQLKRVGNYFEDKEEAIRKRNEIRRILNESAK